MERTTTGSISSTNASETANALWWKPSVDDPQAEDEQRGDNGRHAGKDVDHERRHPGERAATVLDKKDRGHHAQRDREDSGDPGLDDRAVERVIDTAGERFG